MTPPKVVCVVNNYDIFNKVVKSNINLNNCEIFDYDNTISNISISKRYNNFITQNVNETSDFWILFIHQDFGIEENIEKWLEKTNKENIYGAVGAKMYEGVFIGKSGVKRNIVVNFGKIKQGNNNFNFKEYGKGFLGEKDVDTTDCCCLIVHSSTINKFNLRFDENLDFHMYAEDFCFRAKHDYKIKIKIKQMDCFHLGRGNIDENFTRAAAYLKQKFKIKRVPSTCRN